MNQANQVQDTLQRLLAINWKKDSTRFKSHKALLHEYFRRSSLWAKALHATDRWPILDLAWHIDPTVRVDETTLHIWREHLRHRDKRVPREMESLLEAALQWAAVEDQQLTEAFKLPNPYEPMIVMYERGGYFYRSHEGIEITSVTAISRQSWQAYSSREVPYDSIEEADLDKIDFGDS